MHIQGVFYQNFRNFQTLEFHPAPGFTVLVGPNGAGKTNFLEGIYFGATLRRFPESKLAQLFCEGEKFFKIRLEPADPEQFHQVTYERSETGYTHELKLSQQPIGRVQYAGQLPVISFLPQDLSLLTRSPGGRRGYLDEALSLVSPEYRFAAIQYEKALRQRGELLAKIRGGSANLKQLEIWDERVAEFGSEITKWRARFIEYLNLNVVNLIRSLSPSLAALNFVYQNSGAPEKPQFLQKLGANRQRDLELGVTTTGPHRDDFQTFLADKDAVGYVSRGQMRIITVALKILEREYLEQFIARPPTMLLDDVFSEFDRVHQQALIEFLKTLPQVFLTTAHLEEIKTFLPHDSRLYKVEAGTIIPLTNV